MAFHVACPITSRRICFCELGFPRSLHGAASKDSFLEEVLGIEQFLEDPSGVGRIGNLTVQVAVPRVEPLLPPAAVVVDGSVGDEAAEEAVADVSAQSKRVALQKKAAAAMVAAEEYARRFESGDLGDGPGDSVGEEQVQSNGNVMCRICFSGENEGSERSRKMLSCKSCGKKYHRSCLKSWAQHRDLFHWSSWTCPSCRTCEVCRRTGDPNKFMFCRRCDGAYHCYCQHPPHKNVSSGPYLCPKHTKCHSCASDVPGNGLSVRWFLGYTCCDACGRLFVKGNYCPVCLKVYRDSESTPMVCCDICQRWVHCQCDGISDEKYLQFQVDGNLQYKCATCRGECYQVKDLEDAVQELWRRKDITDQDLIASLRAAAGLPTQEDIFSISPSSDEEENGPTVLKNEFKRSIKVSLKGLVDKSPKKTKEYGKKSSNKKPKKKVYQASSTGKSEPHQILEEKNDVHSSEHNLDEDKNGDMPDVLSSPVDGSSNQTDPCFIKQPGVVKHKFIDEVMVDDEDKITEAASFKSNKSHGLDSGEDDGKVGSKLMTVKTKKLVINLGSRKINLTKSPGSDASSCPREHDSTVSNGREDASQQRNSDRLTADGHDSVTNSADGKGLKAEYSSQPKGSKLEVREGNFIKLGRIKPEVPDLNPKTGRGINDTPFSVYSRSSVGKRSSGKSSSVTVPTGDAPTLFKQLEMKPNLPSKTSEDCSHTHVSNSLPKESKVSLKFKIRNPQLENENSLLPHGEEDKSFIKGQRSKRKRPSPVMDKTSVDEDQSVTQLNDNMTVDARILKRLGKESLGKVVEVHNSTDDSWHRGVVTDVITGTSKLTVSLDDGRMRTLELDNEGVRFAPQKQKRSKM